MTINGSGESVIGAPTKIDCDLVLMSGGWNPAVHLFSQSTGKLRYDDALACFVPNVSMQAERSAGACKATFTLAGCLAEGAAAGAEAAKAAGHGEGEVPALPSVERTEPQQPIRPLWVVPRPIWSGTVRPSTSSISRTTSPPPTCCWRPAKAISRSST